MKLPDAFLKSLPLSTKEINDFANCIHNDVPTSIRFNPTKAFPVEEFEIVPWAKNGYYLPSRPRFTSDPAFHAGAYYPQEASSMFLSSLIHSLGLNQKPINALDLCAAPGGKSNLLRSELHPESFLLANETISSRTKILEETLIKWGIPGVAISQKDPQNLGRLTGFFDLILVDAPCSGEGLFRKNPEAINQWSPDTVNLCSARQKRILADIWPALKPGGVLIYSTCTFNRQENEENLQWLCQIGASPLNFDIALQPGIIQSDSNGIKGFRFMPQNIKGEGFFIAAVEKDEPMNSPKMRKSQPTIRKYSHQDVSPASQYIEDGKGNVFALPHHHVEIIEGIIAAGIKLYSPGLMIGKDLNGNFKPEHGYAMLAGIEFNYPPFQLKLDEALTYLTRGDLQIDTSAKSEKVLVQFNGFNLGFAKVRNGRITSDYPINWRILKSAPEQYHRISKSLIK